MEKKFLPAILRKYADRWCIEFYQVNRVGERVRFRKTYDLNRIKSLKERKKRALQLIHELNDIYLPNGYPFVSIDRRKKGMTINDGLDLSLNLKHNARQSTIKSYTYAIKQFKIYLSKHRPNIEYIDDLKKIDALDFLDYMIIDRKISNTTRNSTSSHLRSLFSELVQKEYLSNNPFNNIKKLREEQKRRRPLSEDEKRIISNYVKDNNRVLYLAIKLMYHCFLRKEELRRLKYKHFDLRNEVIRLEGNTTKNKKADIVTIPRGLTNLLINDYQFLQKPPNDYLFNGASKDGSTTIGRNTLTTIHRRIINQLESEGLIQDGKSLHFYSWKDTGAIYMASKMDIESVRKQLRHASLETTQRYLKTMDNFNKAVYDIDIDI